jgi:hypothetical protein
LPLNLFSLTKPKTASDNIAGVYINTTTTPRRYRRNVKQRLDPNPQRSETFFVGSGTELNSLLNLSKKIIMLMIFTIIDSKNKLALKTQ